MAGPTFLARHSLALALALLLAATFAAPLCAQEPEDRIWTDKSGKHEIRAKFVDVVDGEVRLERPNGDITRLPLEKLSQADQKYVRRGSRPRQQKKPALPKVRVLQVGDKVEAEHFGDWRSATIVSIDYEWKRVEVTIDGESDFAWGASLDELRDPKTKQQPLLVKPEAPLKVVSPNYDRMKRPLAQGSPALRIEADPLPAEEAAWKPRAVRLGGSGATGNSMERATGLAIVASSTPHAVILYEGHGFDDDPCRIALINLEGGNIEATVNAPAGTGVLAIAPAGEGVATLQSELHGSEGTGQIDLWKIAKGKLSHWTSFIPYMGNKWPDLNPEWCAWVDDERLFTMNSKGRVILWKVDGATAIYDLQLDGRAHPALTPGRKYLAAASDMGVQFFDVNSGELKAVVGTGDYDGAGLAFSTSGKRLAVTSWGFIDVLDVTTGETVRSFPCEGVNSHEPATWIDDETLFAAHGLIINVPLRLAVWKYEIHSQVVRPFGRVHWALLGQSGDDNQVLTPLALPPPEAKEAVAGLDAEEILAVRPGDKVRIDVQIEDKDLLADQVKPILAQNLADAGMKVDDDSSLSLVAKLKTGETNKVHYHTFGVLWGPGEVIEVTSRVYELELLVDGVPVWKRESIQSAPVHVQLQEDETVRAAIDRVMKPTAAMFQGRVPSYVVRPEYREPLGSSKLSLKD